MHMSMRVDVRFVGKSLFLFLEMVQLVHDLFEESFQFSHLYLDSSIPERNH